MGLQQGDCGTCGNSPHAVQPPPQRAHGRAGAALPATREPPTLPHPPPTPEENPERFPYARAKASVGRQGAVNDRGSGASTPCNPSGKGPANGKQAIAPTKKNIVNFNLLWATVG